MRAFLLILTFAIISVGASVPSLSADDDAYLKASQKDMQWWRDAKFGLFICWGPVTLTGREIGWSRGGERPGVGGSPGETPVEVYDNLYKRFNPTRFDARQWMTLAKSAGVKYIIFLTKHHDGFCMFDTRQSDYNIMSSPFHRDVTKEIADACHRERLKLGLYFSAPDWHDPDYMAKTHDKFMERFRGELRELCTNNGRVSILWFDLAPRDIFDSANTFKMLRELQPGIIINDRLILPGDFRTPEQEIGEFNNKRPWESCVTVANQWTWNPNDVVKSEKECIQTLVRCVTGDGNLALNISPTSSGEIEPLQAQRLREMGAWLRKYGKSIYSTRGGPFVLGETGGSTYRGNRIYLHVLKWPGDTLNLPAIKPRIKSARVLTGGTATWHQTAGGIEISVPAPQRDEIDTIIALDLDQDAAGIEPMK
jgi:alpha-L-fucosidase